MSQTLLVIRLSAMGDVALSVPAIQAVCTQNEDVEVHLLTKKPFQVFFKGIPNLYFVEADLYGKHKGFFGLHSLHNELWKSIQPNYIIDLHDVLRSKLLRFFFSKLKRVRYCKIDKGRKEKKALTRQQNKLRKPLSHSTERYAKVFRQAGFQCDLSQFQPIEYPVNQSVEKFLADIQSEKLIGIAPFAQHQGKAYPPEKMEDVITKLIKTGWQVILFGGGKSEEEIANKWETKFEKVKSAVGKFKFAEELALMGQMKEMLTMDSGNMHLARLVGTPVYSIWGATHPDAGFTPFGQNEQSRIIQVSVEELNCRPCSVFGNKPCHRGDWACMNQISSEMVVERINQEA